MRIGVAGHCETGGMAAALRELSGSDSVTPLVMTHLSDDEWADRITKEFDIIIYNSVLHRHRYDLFRSLEIDQICYPFIQFSAYHPDCCYVRMASTGEMIGSGYHSGICVHAFINEIPADFASDFFNEEMYSSIGYFDYWDSEIDLLRSKFSECSIEFDEFFLSVKRQPPFMHSINHPTAFTISQLAKAVARKIGIANSNFGHGAKMSDTLAGLYWPVYPEIADRYAINGEYKWLADGRFLTLCDFIDRSYKLYSRFGVSRDNIMIRAYKSAPGADKLISRYRRS